MGARGCRGRGSFDTEGLSMAERKLALAVQGQSYVPMFDERLTVAAWKVKPTWFVISANDRMLPPAMEESAAKKWARSPQLCRPATWLYCTTLA